MPIAVAIPADPRLHFEERGALLRVTGLDTGPVEFRVDEGAVFARYLAREPRVWVDVALASVMGYFAENSPVATFLRRQGASPLRQVVLDAKTTDSSAGA